VSSGGGGARGEGYGDWCLCGRSVEECGGMGMEVGVRGSKEDEGGGGQGEVGGGGDGGRKGEGER